MIRYDHPGAEIVPRRPRNSRPGNCGPGNCAPRNCDCPAGRRPAAVSLGRVAAAQECHARDGEVHGDVICPFRPRFDPVAATEAYVARLTPEQIAKSNSYFEGGYWLQLWGFLVSSAISVILLATRLSARMRDLAERVIPFRFGQGPLRTLVFGAQYFLFTTVLSFPLSVYSGYFREHQYNLSNQSFGDWLKDASIGMVVLAVIGGIALMVLYAILQLRAEELVDLGVRGLGGVLVRRQFAGPRLHRAPLQ